MEHEGLYLSFYIISCIGIICSLFVLVSIIRYGHRKNCFTFVLMWFHISMLGQEVTMLPYGSDTSRNSCIALEFFHYYFGIVNIVALALLAEAHRSSILSDPYNSHEKILKYGGYAMFFIPMIAALPFATSWNDLGKTDDDNGWCILPLSGVEGSVLIVYYLSVWFMLLASIALTTYTGVVVFRTDKLLAEKYMSSIGLITNIAIIAWIPRSLFRVVHIQGWETVDVDFASYIPISIAGILFSIIYAREMHQIMRFAEPTNDSLSSQRISFSWEHRPSQDELGQNDNTIAARLSRLTMTAVRPSASASASAAAAEDLMTVVQNPVLPRSSVSVANTTSHKSEARGFSRDGELL